MFSDFLVTCCQRVRKCIDHRLRESVSFVDFIWLATLVSLLLWFVWLLLLLLLLMCYAREILMWSCVWSYYAYCVLAWLYPWMFVYDRSLVSLVMSAWDVCDMEELHQDVCDMEEWPMILIDCAFALKSKFKIMHKFRGSSCLSHTSQSDDVFHSYYHLSKLWSICCHQLPKRGRLKVQLIPGWFW